MADAARMMSRQYHPTQKASALNATFISYLPILTTHRQKTIYVTRADLPSITEGGSVGGRFRSAVADMTKTARGRRPLADLARLSRSDVHAFFSILCDARAHVAAMEARMRESRDGMLDGEVGMPESTRLAFLENDA